jgi:hypothetical protein
MFRNLFLFFLAIAILSLAGCTQVQQEQSKSNKETGYYKIENTGGASEQEISSASSVYSEVISEIGKALNSSGAPSASLSMSGNTDSKLESSYIINKIFKSKTTTDTPLNMTINGYTSGTMKISGSAKMVYDDVAKIGTFTVTVTIVFINFDNGGQYKIVSGTLTEAETGTIDNNSNIEEINVSVTGSINSQKKSDSSTYILVIDNNYNVTMRFNEKYVVIEGTYKTTMNGKTWIVTRKDVIDI